MSQARRWRRTGQGHRLAPGGSRAGPLPSSAGDPGGVKEGPEPAVRILAEGAHALDRRIPADAWPFGAYCAAIRKMRLSAMTYSSRFASSPKETTLPGRGMFQSMRSIATPFEKRKLRKKPAQKSEKK